jgi:hypothetical protein
MFKKKLNKLKVYINKNIKKEFIRLSKLLARYLVIFVPKKIKSYNYALTFRNLIILLLRINTLY